MTEKKTKKTKKKAAPKKMQLLKALEFIKVGHEKGGDATQTHVRLKDGWAVCFNHTMAAGYPILEQELDVCADYAVLTAAIKEFKEGDAITQPDQFNLSLKMGKLTANIPCCNPATVTMAHANDAAYMADDSLKDHFRALDKIVKNAKTIVESTVLLCANSMYVTDLEMIVEIWHNFGLSDKPAIVPKKFIQAIMRTKENVHHLAYGPDQLTVMFQNGAWMRTQLYNDPWPPVWEQLVVPVTTIGICPDFFKGVQHVLNFTKDDYVHFNGGKIQSSPGEDHDASYELIMSGHLPPVSVNGKKIMALSGLVDRVEFGATQVSFFSDTVRASICYPEGQVAF